MNNTTNTLNELKGYDKLKAVDKVKFALSLSHYLNGLSNDDIKNMDIIEVIKSRFKKSCYLTVFKNNGERVEILIKFKRSFIDWC